MPVVINEFEVVAETPRPQAAESPRPEAPAPSAAAAATDFDRQLQRVRDRAGRVRAH